jgi:hypothetical protein
MDFFDTYYNSNSIWGSRGSYILTRFLKSAFTGPVRPTPGTAYNYYDPGPDKDRGFSEKLFLEGKPFDLTRTWPGRPPIDIEIQNLALTKELSGQEDKIILAGINPGNLTDSGSQPNFNTMGPPLGRSSPYQIYSGNGARNVKVTLALHRDMFDYQLNISGSKEIADWYEKMKKNQEAWINLQKEVAEMKRKSQESKDDPMIPGDLYSPMTMAEYERYVEFYQGALNQAKKQTELETLNIFRNTINWFRAIQYPVYTKEGGVIAPRVFMRIGQFIRIEGWPSVSISYENIYSEGFPVKVNIDFQVTETVQKAYDQTDIMSDRFEKDSAGMGTYVRWTS